MPREHLVAVSYPVTEDYTTTTEQVLDGEASIAYLRAMPEAESVATLSMADALITWNPGRELPSAALEQGAVPRFVQLLSAGADGVDFGVIPDHVVVAGNVGAYARPIAEHVLAMTLALARRLPQRHAELAAGEFNQSEPLITLDGAVCAILGFGGIGKATAALLRAMGARIHAVNTTGVTSEPVDFASSLADLDQVLTAADVVVISLPLTKATRSLIGARELALMKPTAILVNVARGAILDEEALYQHLRDHPQFCAGIDAWWHEPRRGSAFRTDFPFFDLPNLLGSPHNSGIVAGVMESAAAMAAENVLRYLRGQPVTGVMRREDYT